MSAPALQLNRTMLALAAKRSFTFATAAPLALSTLVSMRPDGVNRTSGACGGVVMILPARPIIFEFEWAMIPSLSMDPTLWVPICFHRSPKVAAPKATPELVAAALKSLVAGDQVPAFRLLISAASFAKTEG